MLFRLFKPEERHEVSARTGFEPIQDAAHLIVGRLKTVSWLGLRGAFPCCYHLLLNDLYVLLEGIEGA